MSILDQLLASLGGGGAPTNRLIRDQNLMEAGYVLPNRLAAPQGAPQAGFSPSPAPQAAPQVDPSQTASTAGGGGFLSRLFGGGMGDDGNPALNETVTWLIRQGYDPGTAHALAGNKAAMQKVLLSQVGGNQPNEPPTSYQEYQLAKKDGFEGSYTDWQTKSIREQDPGFSHEKDLRQEYDLLPEVKDYKIVRSNYERIRKGVEIGTGAGDAAIVFGYMKMLDPTSVVRESEQANAQNAAGVPETVRGMWNTLVGGGTLSAEARQQILQAAEQVYGEASTNITDVNKRYEEIAKQWQIDPLRVFAGPEQYEPLAPQGALGTDVQPAAPAADDGWFVGPGGVRMRKGQ